MKLALDNDDPQPLKTVNPFVDGAAVGIPGKRTHEIIKNIMPCIQLIPEGVVCSALLDLYNAESIVVEPAGALAIAGVHILFIHSANYHLESESDQFLK